MNNDFTKFHDDIVFWGPPKSGKSWLIKAFAKSLNNYNENDPDFFYNLMDSESYFPIISSLNDVSPTTQPTDTTWSFARKAKKNTYSHQISSQVHRIRVRDDKGSSLVELEHAVTQSSFRESSNIFILLDPTSIGQSARGSSDDLPAFRYPEMLAKLLDTMNLSKNEKRFLAVCITKVDQVGARRRDPWEIIQIYFGREFYALLQQYNKLPNLEIQTFSTSACGFLSTNSELEPNFDVATGGLKDSNNWKPYNVEAPFFWIFESIERNRLQASFNLSVLGKQLFSIERQANYIHYPIQRF